MPSDFETLIHQHGARIRRIARRYASSGAVDDLVQDICVRLWRSYPGFKAHAKVETWIYRVALNAAMSSIRNTLRERQGRAALSAQPPPSPAPAHARDMHAVLESFLAQVGSVDASVLMMYLDGLSAEEMGAILGISANAIAVRISRLKDKFTALYVD
jgi:RNA polymerase sigma-70 factor (ECF subfamily)